MSSPTFATFRGLVASGLLLASAANLHNPLPTPKAVFQPSGRYQGYFDSALPAQMAAEHLVGASVAVVEAGRLVFARGYGYQDAAHQVPVSADDTVFFIGSDGKLFTWTAVMQLVEQGRLDLHADVNRYLDFRLPDAFADPITLHHLLTHTAGFEDDYRSLFVATPDQVRSLGDHVRTVIPARVYPPGTVMAYSNYGTALAGYIVERVAGEPFDHYLRSQVLAPLGMTHSWSGLDLPGPLQAALSAGFRHPFGLEQSAGMEWTAASPAAPIRATATDMSRFMLAHLGSGCVANQCILKPDTIDLMHARQFAHPGQSDGMAYGWMSSTFNGQRVLWHLGESAHFVTIVALLPDRDLGLFFSFNSAPASWRTTLSGFLDAFFPIERPTTPAEPLLDWETRARAFNGLYAPARRNWTSFQSLGALTALTQIAIDQGRLTFNGWDFVETAPGSFAQENGDRRLTLHQGPDGRRWVYVGVQAYYQVPGTSGVLGQLGPFALHLVIGVAALVLGAWSIGRQTVGLSRLALALTAGVVVYNTALAAGLGWVLIQLAQAYIYDQTLMTWLSYAAWLTVAGALALSGVAAAGWLTPSWPSGWRICCTIVALSSWGFAAWLWQAKVMAL